MASMGYGIWLGVGVLVTLVSLLMPQMRAFVVVGVIFLLVGIIKLMLARRQPKMAREDTYHKISPKREMQAQESGNIVCFVCSATNSTKANFCGHCGHRLRRPQ